MSPLWKEIQWFLLKKKIIPLFPCTDNLSPLSFFSLIYTLKASLTPIVCFKGVARAPGLYRWRAAPLGWAVAHWIRDTGSKQCSGCAVRGKSCAVGEQWGSSAGRMEFPLWKLLCALALVKSAIKCSVLKRFFNDVLNSEVSKFESCVAVHPLISCLNTTILFSRVFLCGGFGVFVCLFFLGVTYT